MENTLVPQDESLESLVARVVDEFRERQKAGERPDAEEYAARYPHAADLLRKVLASWQLIGLSAAGGEAPFAAADAVTVGTLGDFGVLREVGRGGMAVVYEAEQLSLGRRVALKVLPFAATMDSRWLQRFHNEARAAAALEHPHIVPVYGVGCERGVHYYAMRLINGQTLAQVIARQDSAATQEPTTPFTAAAGGADTVRAAAPTSRAPQDAAFFRRAAEWGAQAAEALEYAHSLGVVHRDVKPANLLIDGDGKLWVTDFGLARTTADTGLTMTGDVLGTLRYMSPEQALAEHGLVDHRTDVYALGATLYELVTGTPTVAGKDREEILRNLTDEEPQPPRRRNGAVPADLETIVLKALSREPGQRYASARELADDLRRFLEDRPIRARRPSFAERGRKWAHRHRRPLLAAAVAALLATAAGVAWVWYEKRQTDAALVLARDNETKANSNATRADAQRQRAEGHLKDMLVLVDAQLDHLAVEVGRSPRPAGFSEKLAKQCREIVPVLEKMDANYVDDPAHRRRLARATSMLGGLQLSGEQYAEAVQAYRRAEDVYAKLVMDFPHDCDLVHALGLVSRDLGHGLRSAGELREAEAAYGRCISAWQRLVKDFPKDPAYPAHVLLLPQMREPLAELFWSQGRFKEAEDVYHQAMADCRKDVETGTKEFKEAIQAQQRMLATDYRACIGRCLAARGLFAEADAEYRRLQLMRQEDKGNPLALKSNVRTLAEVAWFRAHCSEKKYQDLAEAVQLAQEAARGTGVNPEFRLQLAVIQYRAADYPAAKATLDETAKLLQKRTIPVHGEPFANAAFRCRLAFTLALVRWRTGNQEGALQAYRVGLDRLKKCRPVEAELLALRDEAATLLGVSKEEGKSTPPP